MIIANPIFDQEGKPTTVVVQANAQTRSTRGSSLSRDAISGFRRLPGTAAEAEAIAPLFPQATVLTQAAATENAVKTVRAPQILHIATHGFFLSDLEQVAPRTPEFGSMDGLTARTPATPLQKNPPLCSGLALAGYNLRKSGSEDGVLTALEVANLRLRGTELVVLSACETGVGEVGNGEGVYGLRRAFVIAGARSSVFSLWRVNDEATKDLMVKYYQRLQQGMGRTEALRQTQLEMLRSPEYQHPYYWAAFLPAGAWNSLKN